MPRQLPGIRFENPVPPKRDLPRMDIAGFVGFAASGPLHCPVPVEDAEYFASIFGAEAPILRDVERGEWVSGYLAPAVRAFLRNGGQRCWVVRVADVATAETSRFPLPGVMCVRVGDGGQPVLAPAVVWARSQGSWADDIRVGTALSVRNVDVKEAQINTTTGLLDLRTAARLEAGDVLQLHYPDFRGILLVESVSQTSAEPESVRDARQVRVCSGRALWFEPPPSSLPGSSDGQKVWYEGQTSPASRILTYTLLKDNTIQVRLDARLSDAPSPGMMMRLGQGPRSTWVMVTEAIAQMMGPSDTESVQVAGVGLTQREPLLSLPEEPLPRCERLSMDLFATAAGHDPFRLSGLDFGPAKARYWGALPNDIELFSPKTPDGDETFAGLWQEASQPRFPLAAHDSGDPGTSPLFTFPLGMGALADTFTGAFQPEKSELERNGLRQFRYGMFLDRDLDDAFERELTGLADAIRYTAPTVRSLTGIHALMSIDEVTLVAAPDAIHQPWREVLAEGPPDPETLEPIKRPEWWHYADCDVEVRPIARPETGNFLDASIRVLDPPRMEQPGAGVPSSIELSWEPQGGPLAGEPSPVYILEESSYPDFTDSHVRYEGSDAKHTVYGRGPGDYYYHVRMVIGPNTSDWSAGVVVRIGQGGGWGLLSPAAVSTPNLDLLSIHRALLRMCSARGDQFAVLSLPVNYREDDTIAYAALLGPSTEPVFGDRVMPLSYGELPVLSYGAVYHPWLIESEQTSGGTVRRAPPDGAICGMIARRALARGAWVAPANEPLNGVVALTPPLARTRWLDLQEAQINVIRQEPDGFLTLSSDTLSRDPDLLPITVRRLLHLLRRMVQRMGDDFVFEPMNDAFRRMARRDIETVLTTLFTRGAFAGKTTDSSYQVVMNSTPQDMDAGRFIVDVKVAPSLPMTFLTVRLVQTGEQLSISEGV